VIKRAKVDDQIAAVTDRDTDKDIDVKVDDDSIFVTLRGGEKNAVDEPEKLKKG
jgi:hypothetical protein